jgi:LysM repeat protein
MVDPDRFRVWVARLAAPIAFFFAATVLVVLVQRGLESNEGEAGSGTVPTQTDTTTGRGPSATQPDGTTTTPSGGPCLANRTRVREGETLEAIAARCDVPVDQILELNPGIDPLALSVGQKVRIRPVGAQADATQP